LSITKKNITHHLAEIDPGFLVTKRSLKTFLAILISLLIFYNDPGMAMFAAVSSLLISKSQTGLTLQDRKFSLLATGTALSVFSIPISVISQHEIASVIFVVVAAFVTFFLIGLRLVPDFSAVVVFSISTMELAFSKSFSSGLEFAGLFLLITALVFIIHFIILPTRPKIRLHTQLEFINKQLEKYFDDIAADYPDLETGISATQISAAEARKSISEFKRVWHLLRISDQNKLFYQTRFLEISKGLEDLFEYMLLVWQFRARVWDSKKFSEHILGHPRVREIIHGLLRHYHPSVVKDSDDEAQVLQQELKKINHEYLEKYKIEKDDVERAEWVAIFNALHSLLALTENIGQTAVGNIDPASDISTRERFSNFLQGISGSIQKLKFQNQAFRFGLRSAIIIGATMAYSTFFSVHYGFWLVLFATLLIRPNLGVSIKAGRERLIGTIVGCLAGFVFVSLVPAGSIIFYIIILATVFFMIWFSNLDNFIMMITALTFLIIGLFSLIYPGDSSVPWLRLAYTVGIVVFVVFISFLLWPEKARKKFANALADTIESEKQFFLSIIAGLLKNNSTIEVNQRKQQLTLQLNTLEEVIDATKNEILQNKVIHHGLNIQRYILRMRNTLHSMDFASAGCHSKIGFPEVENKLQHFANHTEESLNILIEAFRKHQRAENLPDLRADFLSLRDSFRVIRGASDPEKDEITQLWNISTFIWNLKPLILELEAIKAEIDLKMDEG